LPNFQIMELWRDPFVASALLAALAAPALAAEERQVQVERRGELFHVTASASIAAPIEVAWQVLTDYARLPLFVPGIIRSDVLLRAGNRALVEQVGEARFLVFSFPIEIRLEVHERPRESVDSRAISGNMRSMWGRYELQEDAARGGVRLRYFGALEPDFALPPLIGVAALRGTIQDQFEAMVREIERRGASAPPGK
jgi:hypothetical protein